MIDRSTGDPYWHEGRDEGQAWAREQTSERLDDAVNRRMMPEHGRTQGHRAGFRFAVRQEHRRRIREANPDGIDRTRIRYWNGYTLVYPAGVTPAEDTPGIGYYHSRWYDEGRPSERRVVCGHRPNGLPLGEHETEAAAYRAVIEAAAPATPG